ncbi:hypothetical protein [Amycolatopsis sp. 195334CR]|uniref:hypothetical protein n=1 Tax=Amycolatopsis sp. 195334CR TaxID=2814588 RepID=UPI001A901AE9|nr:hypothetical protein [Amycolatopsis sp. 195334CR]MBN6039073.1 hypothetical protein [Amycolatopsis sp. 195334CR]
MDPRVSGWLPAFLPADEQLHRQAARLRSLSGLRVAQTWTIWNLAFDEWFADLPVVLRLERGPQLEISWAKLDDLSLTWDTIDVAVEPEPWFDWPLEWRRAAHPALAAIEGEALQRISATSFRFVTENVADASDVQEAWLTTGLWLATNRGGLHVFNALDENGLSAQTPPLDTDHVWRHI